MMTLEALRATLPVYPIELQKPDIRRWQAGTHGVDYVHTFDSGVAGPHVMINALTHGNELCGAIAVDAFLAAGLCPARGRLTLSFANVEAYERFDMADPDATRFVDEDLNRVWSADKLDGPGNPLELRRARALRPVLDTVDFLFDIHSMHEKAAPLMLTGPLPKGVAFARQVGAPAHIMIDAGHAAGRRLRDYAGFGEADSPKNALLIECGQHFERVSRDVALDASARFLVALGTVDADAVSPWLGIAPPLDVQCIRVTHPVVARSVDLRFAEDYRGMELLARQGSVIATDGDATITTPYDRCVLLQPSLRHLAPGVTVVRLGQLEAG
jgi:predicted deacylase